MTILNMFSIYKLCDLILSVIIEFAKKFYDCSIEIFFNFFNVYTNIFWQTIFGIGSADLLLFSVFSILYAAIMIFMFGRFIGSVGTSIFSIFITLLALINITFVIIFKFFNFWIVYFSYFKTGSIPNIQFEIPVTYFYFGKWISCSTFDISWGFVFDPLALGMIWVVLFVTLMVQIYCLDYMWNDPFFSKFYAYLAIFAFFMLFLVISSNYLQIFFGWEGVGLASFILISFWSTREAAVLAGMKAMFLNRCGDLFFLIALVCFLKEFSSLDFNIIRILFSDVYIYNSSIPHFELSLIAFSLVFAAIAKSAQLGLHMWLPDAMEGPTPVSALIHAATMVTAGIFVLIRSSYLLVQIPAVLNFMIVIGSLTALFGASVACVQFDIKKVIAYSTCSQLGYMMLACGFGNFNGAFFHLINHAFFKALLFLSSGSVIHAMSNEQDMRKMGALSNFLPFTYIIMVFGSASLVGIPFSSGFYSKDNILEYGYSLNSVFSLFGFICGIVAAFCTAFYSFRLIYLVFLGPYNGCRSLVHNIHEPPIFMSFSLIILLIPSVVIGFLFHDLFVGPFSPILWETSIVTSKLDFYILPVYIQQAPTFFGALGLLISYLVYASGFSFDHIFKNKYFTVVYEFIARKWYFDDILGLLSKNFMYIIFRFFWYTFEKGFLSFVGPNGISRTFQFLSSFIDTAVSKILLSYLKAIIFGIFFMIFCFILFDFAFDIDFFFFFPIIFIFQICALIYYITYRRLYFS